MGNAVREPRRALGVSRRALIIGFALIPPNVFFLVRSVYQWNDMTGPVCFNVVTFLLALALLNQLLKRWRPQWVLRTGELLTLYAMLSLSTGLVGGAFSVGGSLPSVITYPFWHATPENRWQEIVWPYYPSWLTVREPLALEGFWSGGVSPYAPVVIKAWLGPALWWASFMAAVLWVCLCLSSIVRRRWSDEEKLPFPFVTVPVQLAEDNPSIFRSKLWWFALAGSFAVGIWNTTATVLPSLPAVPMGFGYTAYVLNRYPWQYLADLSMALTWHPWQIGLCYLAPLDLLFSLLVFDILWAVSYVTAHYLGYGGAAGAYPHFEQACGGMVALAVGLIWFDRRYFAQVLRKALGMKSLIRDEDEEAFSYRFALLGAIIGFGYCCWFWARAGVPTWVLFSFFGLYFAFMMVVSRIRAQVGPPMHEVWAAMPDTALRAAFGQLALGPRASGMFSLLTPFLIGDQENNQIPAQIESFKMAEVGRMRRRRLAIALAFVPLVTIICSFWAYVHFGYQLGTSTGNTQQWLSWTGRASAQGLASALDQPMTANPTRMLGMGVGFVNTLLLLVLKLRVAWWPIHPIAYPIANSWFIHQYTLTIFGVWVVKALLLRYGGLRAHRLALPLFLGLLVGDFASQMVSDLAGLLFHIGT